MGRDTLEFEEIGDEIYIVVDGKTIGRILDQQDDNYYITFEDSNEKIAIHGLDSAKNFVRKYYKEHQPIY